MIPWEDFQALQQALRELGREDLARAVDRHREEVQRVERQVRRVEAIFDTLVDALEPEEFERLCN